MLKANFGQEPFAFDIDKMVQAEKAARYHKSLHLPAAALQAQNITTTEPSEDEFFKVFQPWFRNLYLFPGFSMFNHACRKSENAKWAYDDEIPNRVLVWRRLFPAGPLLHRLTTRPICN